jgi:4-amino-4-deoxy-L-arabinose transferase-like glycosyltransferase
LHQLPRYHDEAAYLLQAQIFADGRWAAPPPPIPEFFEQAHTLVTPVRAGKYPPGTALMMTPGAYVGLPGVPIALLAGITAALLFALGRRVGGTAAGALCVLLWLGSPDNLRFRAAYLSESVTTALWLLGLWSVLRWREDGRARWLLVLGLATGWQAITRPLTALAFAVPLGIVGAVAAYRMRRWSVLVLPVVACAAVTALLLVWSKQTMGSWREPPIVVYTRDYMPWDRLGFGYDSTPPPKSAPADIAALTFREAHEHHTLANLPVTLATRVTSVWHGMFPGWRTVLLPFAIVGLMGIGLVEGVAVACAVTLVLAYLSYAHNPDWTVYYLETLPIIALIAARGVVLVGRCIGPRAALELPLFVILVLAQTLPTTLRRAAVYQERQRDVQRNFRERIAQLPEQPAIVFVRYAPDHSIHQSLIWNDAFLDRVRTWVVYDRGADNARLTAMFPERTPYLYDEATDRLLPLGH